MVPMFEDWARIWVAVSRSVPCCSASWNVYLPMGSVAGTVNTVVGRDDPVWQGRRERHQLEHRTRLVDLGDRGVGERLGHAGRQGVGLGHQGGARGVGAAATLAVRVAAGGRRGRVVDAPDPLVAVRLAMARMSPVFTSMMTAVPPVAWEATISAAKACSVTYWTDSSRVSSIPVPGCGRRRVLPVGSATPSGESIDVGRARLAGQGRLVLVLEARGARRRSIPRCPPPVRPGARPAPPAGPRAPD